MCDAETGDIGNAPDIGTYKLIRLVSVLTGWGETKLGVEMVFDRAGKELQGNDQRLKSIVIFGDYVLIYHQYLKPRVLAVKPAGGKSNKSKKRHK